MDFRQCPACQASVLDDDAAECPFCGASMSGKPTAAPAKPAPAQSKPPAERPAAKSEPAKRQAPARKVGETVADEDDPFGIDTSSVTQVPKVAPKPAKGRMIRVQCPMCETPGFISSKMQGKDVKCCNPDCMVPVFSAPLPKKEEEEDTTSKRGISGKAMGITAGVAVLLGGLLFWGFYLSRQQAQGTDSDIISTPYVPGQNQIGGTTDSPVDTASQVTPPPKNTISLQEIQKQSLSQIVTAAQARDDNRKAFGRRLAAEAYAATGDLKNARAQLTQLQKRSVGGRVPYFQVEPLLLIGWQELAQGQTDAALQSVQQAAEAFDQLPQVGRDVLTAGIALAAAQATFDQIPQARQTLRKIDAEYERARVAALLQITMSMATYDLDDLLRYTSFGMSVDPLAVAVAVEIAAHGRWDKAIAWAGAQPDLASREDCIAALATFAALHAVRTQDSEPVSLVQGISGLTPTGQTRMRAGLATGYLMAGDRSRAESELGSTLQSFSAIQKPAAVTNPSVKEIHDSDGKPNAGLPEASPLQSSAVAAMQVARLQATLGQKEAAWSTLLQAWDFTAAIGPSLSYIAGLVDEFENRRARTEAKLEQQLNLRNRDQKYQARNQYRGQLRVFESAADSRFDLERMMLRDAVTLGFGEQVDAFRANPRSLVEVAGGQPYEQARDDDRLIQAFNETEGLFTAGQYTQAADLLAGFRDSQNKRNEEKRDLRALQLACRLLKLKKVNTLFSYSDALRDPWLTEDALELTTALSVSHGLAPQIWELHQRHDLQPTEKVAIYRGLISGIQTEKQQHPQPAQTAAAE